MKEVLRLDMHVKIAVLLVFWEPLLLLKSLRLTLRAGKVPGKPEPVYSVYAWTRRTEGTN